MTMTLSGHFANCSCVLCRNRGHRTNIESRVTKLEAQVAALNKPPLIKLDDVRLSFTDSRPGQVVQAPDSVRDWVTENLKKRLSRAHAASANWFQRCMNARREHDLLWKRYQAMRHWFKRLERQHSEQQRIIEERTKERDLAFAKIENLTCERNALRMDLNSAHARYHKLLHTHAPYGPWA
jgi:chromosome segregation ATPase